MKIAILNWRDLAHPDAGGAEIFIGEVGQRWAEAGNQVRIFSSKIPGAYLAPPENLLEVARVGRQKLGSHHLLAPHYVSEWKPDVVLESINTIPYLLPWRFRRVAYVSLFHQLAVDVWDHHLPRPLPSVARLVERSVLAPYRRVAVIAVSQSTKADLAKQGLNNVTVVPQGGLGRSEQQPKANSPTFMFIGRLVENKRPHHALEAFRRIKVVIPRAQLWMVGDGALKDKLRQNPPDGVEFLGRLPRRELLDRMSRAHVILCTSVREGWGLVVTEANALGTPAVAYDVPGLRDSVRHGETGLLTAVDPQALAEAASSLVSDSRTYATIRDAAIEWGAAYSWDRTGDFLLELLQECARVSPPTPTLSAET